MHGRSWAVPHVEAGGILTQPPVSAGLVNGDNAYVVLFQNPTGGFVLEDSWVYNGTAALRTNNPMFVAFPLPAKTNHLLRCQGPGQTNTKSPNQACNTSSCREYPRQWPVIHVH